MLKKAFPCSHVVYLQMGQFLFCCMLVWFNHGKILLSSFSPFLSGRQCPGFGKAPNFGFDHSLSELTVGYQIFQIMGVFIVEVNFYSSCRLLSATLVKSVAFFFLTACSEVPFLFRWPFF